MARFSVIRGVGTYLPKKILDNHALSTMMDTSDAWIKKRTGIHRRHIAAAHETTSDMGLIAAQGALDAAGIQANQIDLIIMATTTPENTFPATATRLQAKLGAYGCSAFDIQAVCSGFIYGLVQADNAIRSGQASRVLLVGAEIYSRILDWESRDTAVLFGDGAGAVVLEAREQDGQGTPQGILATDTGADGRFYDMLYVDGGPGTTGLAGHVRMQGKDVFRYAVIHMAESVERAMEKAGLAHGKPDWLIPHQANIRIIDKVGEKLGLDPEQVIVTVHEHANISAATIPLAFAHGEARFKEGNILALTAMGGGFTWGAVVLRW